MEPSGKKITGMPFDWPLFGAVFFLNMIGLLNLASAASNPGFWHRQLFSFAIGFGLMILVAGIDYRFFERSAYAIYGICLFFLLTTFFLGTVVAGTRGWIRLGTFSLQPSEPMKIGVILALAKYFHDERKGGAYGIRDLLMPLAIGFGPAFFIALQPDTGTMVMLSFVIGGMILFMGINRRIIYTCVAIVAILLPIMWYAPPSFGMLRFKDHQKNRVLNFFDPYRDPRGTGYNVIQSMVAVGSGKVTGKGYKLGTQTALKYLPERHSDFVFSVLGEEWGFLGCFVALMAYLFILLWGIKISAASKNRFGALTALGIVLMFFCHTAINVAMTLGAFPVVGIPLPFMSYGGSFLITSLIGVGLLMSIEERRWMF